MAVEIRRYEGEKLPLFDLDRTRDALQVYGEVRWRYGRRKAWANTFDLSNDEARSVCDGRCSWATFDKIIRHKNGGWKILLPIYGALLNQSVEEFMVGEAKLHAAHSDKLLTLVSDNPFRRAVSSDDPADLDTAPRDRRKSVGR